jgi:type II secretory pathway pseudopilin PulG
MLSRRGIALVEVLVSLAMLGVLGTLAVQALLSSVRSTERVVLRTERDGQLAVALESGVLLLPALSAAAGDPIRLSDTAAVWHSTVAHGPVCAVSGTVAIAADTRNDAVRLGSYTNSPQAGDVLHVFDDGAAPPVADDGWSRHQVQSARWVRGGCGSSPLLDPVTDATFGAWVLDVAPAVDSARIGVPARVTRQSRLALYRSATEWSLGYSELGPGGTWSTIQPVAGPLEPPGHGLRLLWLDSAFVPGTAAPVAMRLVATAPTRVAVRSALGATIHRDSVQRLLHFPNRR